MWTDRKLLVAVAEAITITALLVLLVAEREVESPLAFAVRLPFVLAIEVDLVRQVILHNN